MAELTSPMGVLLLTAPRQKNLGNCSKCAAGTLCNKCEDDVYYFENFKACYNQQHFCDHFCGEGGPCKTCKYKSSRSVDDFYRLARKTLNGPPPQNAPEPEFNYAVCEECMPCFECLFKKDAQACKNLPCTKAKCQKGNCLPDDDALDGMNPKHLNELRNLAGLPPLGDQGRGDQGFGDDDFGDDVVGFGDDDGGGFEMMLRGVEDYRLARGNGCKICKAHACHECEDGPVACRDPEYFTTDPECFGFPDKCVAGQFPCGNYCAKNCGGPLSGGRPGGAGPGPKRSVDDLEFRLERALEDLEALL